MSTTYIRVQKKQGKVSLSLVIIIVAIIIVVAAIVVVNTSTPETYVQLETKDNIQKLTDNIADTARQMNTDELQLQRAIETVESAQAILASSTTEYNDAIEAFEFYQQVK